MKNFKYIQPKSLKEAAQFLGKNPATALPVAGGTDLLGLMKTKIVALENVVNLKSISGLDKINYKEGKELRIGALVTISDIAKNPVIKKKFTVLAQAAEEVASPQLRNMGTIGGNLCQRPRCWYFRGEFNCLRKGGDDCFAVDGKNKFHCIIGGGPCFIVHPSDTAVALMALGAVLVVASGKKSRKAPINDFFILPDQDVEQENILLPGEIVTEIIVPEPAAGTVSGYLKFKERAVWDFAVVSVAAVLQKNSSSIKTGKLAYGGVAPKPWLEEKVSRHLTGLKISKENLEKAAKEGLADAEPLEENKYKIILARNLTKRLLNKLVA